MEGIMFWKNLAATPFSYIDRAPNASAGNYQYNKIDHLHYTNSWQHLSYKIRIVAWVVRELHNSVIELYNSIFAIHSRQLNSS